MNQDSIGPVGLVAKATPGGPELLADIPGSQLDPPIVRLRLDVAYDGTDFSGWARQPDLRTVQGVLETGLGEVLRVPGGVRVACAGRTDAGVHARGQVCHVDIPLLPGIGQRLDEPARLLGQLHGRLPADLQVRGICPAPAGFDARWSALWRQYAYRVADPVSGFDPLTRRSVLWSHRPLDVPAMAEAARAFVGEHDFAAYCKHREGASTVRTILGIGWQRSPEGIAMHVRSDAFCHSMVRSLVGAFLAVGLGRWPVGRPAAILAGGVRVPGSSTAPAHGLCLEQVGYPPDEALAEQALRAKRWRG